MPLSTPSLVSSQPPQAQLEQLSPQVQQVLHLPWWRRMLQVQRQQARQVITEALLVKEIFPLLMKVRNGGRWTPEEKELLLSHLRRLARLSPYLLLLLLPGSAILLPLYAWWLDRRRGQRQGVQALPPDSVPAASGNSLPPSAS